MCRCRVNEITSAKIPAIKTQTKPNITHLAFHTRDYALPRKGGEKSAGGFLAHPRKALENLKQISLRKLREFWRRMLIKQEPAAAATCACIFAHSAI